MASLPLVQVRRQHLEDEYGFICNCPRCTAEAALPAELRAALLDHYNAVNGPGGASERLQVRLAAGGVLRSLRLHMWVVGRCY